MIARMRVPPRAIPTLPTAPIFLPFGSLAQPSTMRYGFGRTCARTVPPPRANATTSPSLRALSMTAPLVSRNSDSLHKSRSAAPGWQGARQRAYREYVSDEQRSQPGCPARELCDESLLRDTKSPAVALDGDDSQDARAAPQANAYCERLIGTIRRS